MWIQITDEILPELFADRELAAVAEKRAAFSADPVPGILSSVATLIRSRLQSGGSSRLQGDELSIPECLRDTAGDLIRHKLLTRFALTISDAREKRYDEAMRTLRELSDGSYVIPDEGQDNTPAPHYSGRPSRWGMSRHGGVM